MRKFYLLFFCFTLSTFGAFAQAQKASDLVPEGKSILKSANTVTQIMPEIIETSDCTIDALLLTADAIEYVQDVQTYLMNTGMFNVVDIINYDIPTLPTLRHYDAILVWTDGSIDDTIGDTLAAYIDEGGGVVSAVFNLFVGWGIEGTRFNTDYLLLNLGAYSSDVTTTLGTVHDPNHPIMDLVSTLSNSTSYRSNNATMTTGSVVIAEWSDGLPLVVVKENLGPANARRADINLFPPSSTVRSDLWDATTDGDILLANALVWVSKKCNYECPSDITVENDPGACGAVVNYNIPSAPDAGVTQIDESGLTSGNEFPVGTTLQEWEFDYGYGIKDTCSFTVTVVDVEPPVVDCPEDMVVSTDPGECHAVVNFPTFNLVSDDEAPPGITLPNAPTNQAGVAYNPDKKLYYAVRAGSSGYLLYTYDESGNQVAENTAGFDFRGLWWNPNNSSLEGNSYNGQGYRSVDLDANGYALSTGATDPVSNYQPDLQSQGDYDYDLDEVIYCDNNTIYRTSRATGLLIDDIAVTGLPANTINTTFVGYTGISGGEVLIYDYVNKAVYFIDKTTGAYSWSVQLPSSAPGQASYNTSYANSHIWITDGSVWHSYKIVGIVSDNCRDELIVEQTAGLPSGSEFPVGITTNAFTVTDGSGNTTECTFNITVIDEEPPVVVCPDHMIIHGTDNESGAMVEFAADATDNCGDATLSYSQEPGTYFPVGTTIVTVTATDEAENTATCEFEVTVIDDENPPVVDKPVADTVVHANQETKIPVNSVFNNPDGDDMTLEVSMADGSPVPDWINLEGDSLVFTPVPADTGCVLVILTATNQAGASVADTFEICVVLANRVNISIGKFEVQLYPNPTPGEVNIDLKPGAMREIQLTVFDITGKPVLLRNYSPSGRIIFDMTGGATGMYFVRIDFDGHSVLKKLVVERQ